MAILLNKGTGQKITTDLPADIVQLKAQGFVVVGAEAEKPAPADVPAPVEKPADKPATKSSK